MNNANMVNDNFGFVDVDGHFRNADFPTGSPASPPVDQLLGVNDNDVAVGFYTDANGNNHGYSYNINDQPLQLGRRPGRPGRQPDRRRHQRPGRRGRRLHQPRHRQHRRLPARRHGHFTDLAVPGASSTMALGVNDYDEVVGVYTVGSGSSAMMHGFTWTPQHGFTHRR